MHTSRMPPSPTSHDRELELDATLPGVPDPDSVTHTRTSTIGPGAVVGRHVVLHLLGAGAMGAVFAAYDPELDRKVALKLLLPGAGGTTSRLRLLREAQALAKLSHPNVVTIHDVGTMDEQVWLAMEFVQGQTLDAWSKTPRDWRAVLELMRQAGAGLAAAHAAGLLHRDFKPDNVMVGDDGRVCVMDFGLARAHAGMESVGHRLSQGSDERASFTPATSALATNFTQVGTIVGTPTYMAPEQFNDAELTEAADQFAFCVTLWNALYGERPFAGKTITEILGHVLAGQLRPPPKGRAVPSWLRRACERGLSVEPAQRWPSMHALLETLATGRARARTRARTRKGLAVVGMLALLGIGVEGTRRVRVAQQSAACERSGDEVETAWSTEREQALRDALVATGSSIATTTADKTMPWLDHQASAWREARVEVCLDAQVRGRMDADTLDRSLWCLDERRTELQSLVDELTLADADTLHKTVTAAAELSSVAPCRDERMLHALSLPPEEEREALRAVRADVARARNLERAGRYVKGIALVRSAFERAQALNWRPLTAHAGLRLGTLLERTGAYAESEAALEGAYFEASNGVAPELMFDAAAELVYVVGVDAARHDDGLRWGRLAEVALVDVPDDQHLRRASLLLYLGATEANVDQERAKDLDERALALYEEALGTMHPNVAMSMTNLAAIYTSTGAYDEAKALHERALAIYEGTLGLDHTTVAHSLNNLAAVHHANAQYGEARALQLRALTIWQEALGPEHPDVATCLNNLATLSRSTGAYGEARVLQLRALAIREKALGPAHPLVASSLNNLAAIDYALGADDEASAHFTRALAIAEQSLGPEHSSLAPSLVGLANIALRHGRPADAVALAERAASVREKGPRPALELAEARFVLARALWDAPAGGGRDQARALSVAQQVRDAARDAGKAGAQDLADVEAWLATHHTAEP